MTRKEIVNGLEFYTVGRLKKSQVNITVEELQKYIDEIKALKQEPYTLDDAREDFVYDVYNTLEFLPTNDEVNRIIDSFDRVISSIEQEPKTRRCKDCKWWKDSDGVYRRGAGAESKCPINNVSVNHGLGYCYMFEPQERSDKEI